jgi:hypothetical protein
MRAASIGNPPWISAIAQSRGACDANPGSFVPANTSGHRARKFFALRNLRAVAPANRVKKEIADTVSAIHKINEN